MGNSHNFLPNNNCDLIVPINNQHQDATVIDFANNCWIHAQANLKLGECANEKKEMIKKVSDSIWNSISNIMSVSNSNSDDNSLPWWKKPVTANDGSSESRNDTDYDSNDKHHQEKISIADSTKTDIKAEKNYLIS